MDKRKIIAKNRYEEIHYELLEVGEKLLNTKRLTQISLNSINEYTNISKTTIYEHFHSFEEFLSDVIKHCLLYTSPSPRDISRSRMPSSA